MKQSKLNNEKLVVLATFLSPILLPILLLIGFAARLIFHSAFGISINDHPLETFTSNIILAFMFFYLGGFTQIILSYFLSYENSKRMIAIGSVIAFLLGFFLDYIPALNQNSLFRG